MIAFKWDAPVHYYPSWQEIVVTLMIIFAEIWVFRWIVLRMPVMSEHPRSVAIARSAADRALAAGA